ncbi:MAG: hypothetical protein K6G56_01515 [Clostridiales bacterium]|nr:hypothetical protein [Clostridiales bacterium]
MKEKTAYLRGLMDGMKLPDDDNTKLLRAIADCLEAIADEMETESARVDNIEAELDEIDSDIDELDEVIGFLLEEEDEDEDEDEDGEDFDWEDDFDYFTCPNCGEVVPLDEDALQEEADPICPKCNAKLFGE